MNGPYHPCGAKTLDHPAEVEMLPPSPCFSLSLYTVSPWKGKSLSFSPHPVCTLKQESYFWRNKAPLRLFMTTCFPRQIH